MAVSQIDPPQVPAGSGHPTSQSATHSAGSGHTTLTYTVPKKTSTGATGSVTFTDGKITSYTPAT